MNYKKLTLFVLVSWLACFVFPAQSEETANKPNILMILVDDLGYADLGSYGQDKIKTPHLDRMAKQGMRFTQHYAGAPVCGPSRASLFTGLDPGHNPIRGNPKWTKSGKPVDFNQSDLLFSQVLKKAGYTTAIIGKWGLSENLDSLQSMPNQKGFDFFYGYRQHKDAHHYYNNKLYRNNKLELVKGNDAYHKKGLYTHDLFTQEALAYLDKTDAAQPWFLMMSYTIPHLEVTVPEDSKAPYQNLGWPKRKMNTTGHYRNDAEGHTAYAGMVSRMDRDVGRLLDKLTEKGLAKNTLVIFTSDNGPEYDRQKQGFFNSNGQLRGGKRALYEGGIRVPMIAWWPNVIKANSVSHHISAFWDYMATFCQVGRVDCPANNGISFLPTLTGDVAKQATHPYLYWEFNERQGPIQAIRKQQWKLVKFKDKPAELYNLVNDLAETTNIAKTQPNMVTEMMTLLNHARIDHPEFPLTQLTLKKSNQ